MESGCILFLTLLLSKPVGYMHVPQVHVHGISIATWFVGDNAKT